MASAGLNGRSGVIVYKKPQLWVKLALALYNSVSESRTAVVGRLLQQCAIVHVRTTGKR